jgi:hypothetical protein
MRRSARRNEVLAGFGCQEGLEVAGTVGIPAALGAAERGLGVRPPALLGHEHAEVACRRRVSPPVRSPVGGLGIRQAPTFLEQQSEVEGAVGIFGLVGSPVGSRGALHVSPLLQQDAEVAGGPDVPEARGALVGPFGTRDIAPLFEQGGNHEGAFDGVPILSGSVCVSCDPSQPLDHFR